MTADKTTSMRPNTPTKPGGAFKRLALTLVAILIAALILNGTIAAIDLVNSRGQEVVDASISMSGDELTDAGLDELNSMRQKIDKFNEGGGGTPAVNERELDRIDAVVLEIIDGQ